MSLYQSEKQQLNVVSELSYHIMEFNGGYHATIEMRVGSIHPRNFVLFNGYMTQLNCGEKIVTLTDAQKWCNNWIKENII